MKLSDRLAAVACLVPKGSRVADVGTDHGYLPIYLVSEGTAVSAVAMDVNAGPLKRAQEHIREYGLEKLIEVRQSDGLAALCPGEADTVVISGMGGPLMIRILREGGQISEAVNRFILSPQSDIPAVRIYLRENGFAIDQEIFLKDGGKYYTVMSVSHGLTPPGRDIDDLYGKYLLDHSDPVLREYLVRQMNTYQSLLPELLSSDKPRTLARAKRMEKELEQMSEAMQVMDGAAE